MSIEDFAEFLVTNIAHETDLVKVKRFDTDTGIVLEILISESDMPRVIGKQGKVANAIKSIIQVKAYNEGYKNVRINIDSF